MEHKTLLLFTFALAFSASSSWGDARIGSCSEKFAQIHSNPPFFTFKDHRELLTREKSAVELGSGTTAKAKLVRKGNAPSDCETKKIYKRDAFNKDPENQAKFDAEMLNTLGASTREGETFHFVSARFAKEVKGKRTSFVTFTDYVPGRTVHDLLLSRSVPEELKDKIRKIYNRKLRNLKNSLEESQVLSKAPGEKPTWRSKPGPMYFSDEKEDGAPALFAKTKFREARNGLKTRSLIFKSDNVIVDPYDLEKMTVVDPY